MCLCLCVIAIPHSACEARPRPDLGFRSSVLDQVLGGCFTTLVGCEALTKQAPKIRSETALAKPRTGRVSANHLCSACELRSAPAAKSWLQEQRFGPGFGRLFRAARSLRDTHERGPQNLVKNDARKAKNWSRECEAPV